MHTPDIPAGSSSPSRSQRGQTRRRRRAERAYGILFVLTALVVMGDLSLGGGLWHAVAVLWHRIP